jgi:hypothetical protein
LIWVNAGGQILSQPSNWQCVSHRQIYKRSMVMTQHQLAEHTEEDRRTMRRLATVIGGFLVATAIMAVTVGLIMG